MSIFKRNFIILLFVSIAFGTVEIANAAPVLGTPTITKVAQADDKFYLSDGTSYRYVLRVQNEGTAAFESISDRTILSIGNDPIEKQSALLVLYDRINSRQFVLELHRGNDETQVDIPASISKSILQSSPPSLFLEGGKTVMVFKREYAVFDQGVWRALSLEPVLGNPRNPQTTLWSSGKLFVGRHGGEWGEELLEFDTSTQQWKRLFDVPPTAESFGFCILKGHVLLLINGQLSEVTNGGTLTRCVNAPPKLKQICAGDDNTLVCVTDTGALFSLKQLTVNSGSISGNFRQLSTRENKSIRILGVCSDYALFSADSEFLILELNSGKIIVPTGPV